MLKVKPLNGTTKTKNHINILDKVNKALKLVPKIIFKKI